MKFYPQEKGGGKSVSLAEGGGDTTSFGVVFTRKLEVLAILKGGGSTKSFHPLKEGGSAKSFTLS